MPKKKLAMIIAGVACGIAVAGIICGLGASYILGGGLRYSSTLSTIAADPYWDKSVTRGKLDAMITELSKTPWGQLGIGPRAEINPDYTPGEIPIAIDLAFDHGFYSKDEIAAKISRALEMRRYHPLRPSKPDANGKRF